MPLGWLHSSTNVLALPRESLFVWPGASDAISDKILLNPEEVHPARGEWYYYSRNRIPLQSYVILTRSQVAGPIAILLLIASQDTVNSVRSIIHRTRI